MASPFVECSASYVDFVVIYFIACLVCTMCTICTNHTVALGYMYNLINVLTFELTWDICTVFSMTVLIGMWIATGMNTLGEFLRWENWSWRLRLILSGKLH